MSTHYILQLETGTQVCSAALSVNGETVANIDIDEPNVHASRLTLLVEELLQKTGLTFGDLSAVAVSKGPGSYTGLRIGVSTAKGLCYATDLPLIGIDTLAAMATGFAAAQGGSAVDANTRLCPMVDARRMEVYTAVFDRQLQSISPTSAVIVDSQSFAYLGDKHRIVLFGTGADKLTELFAESPSIEVVTGFKNSASHLSRLADCAFREQQFVDVAYFEPYYLKDFVATPPKRG
ncbi:tRNA (adenosine(37)-N6)-threonylcarbamoyltransferase complex dimerization subunit type 1 TsaB [Parapedobacter sp. 10938]|uniref:tRNA (adenosine(37)-N6)-threonylcarbamoyltransferase complex dimerization subunit type 1 TsaB n=1 Tax=Parapedobacter flavus TaxID=3110225 RepID=UPI002DBE6FB6|nr:tRNA (adenosine(37)-N6)-threonylcarbamoyltransferase complex dimerization subunit type 1 TsaB [Parapedobacter sp. 10938]MEC3880593.1 tRNA (adenosine(37)-N6)-threonylcarbamoyltransferase complex dimerization subunit type 1 TsaB [Parapedobacter sp. 10938]